MEVRDGGQRVRERGQGEPKRKVIMRRVRSKNEGSIGVQEVLGLEGGVGHAQGLKGSKSPRMGASKKGRLSGKPRRGNGRLH